MGNTGSDFSLAFDAAFAGLQVEIREACTSERPWPRRVVAAVDAAFTFAARETEAARVLTGDTCRDRMYGPAAVEHLTRTFAEQLREVSGDLTASQGLTEQALIGGVVSLVRKRVSLGDVAAFPVLASEAAQFVLIPYLGREQARRVVLDQAL